ncbi:MAG: tetratricopeptide repeat protein, partial [Saprospiraceae bacterium]
DTLLLALRDYNKAVEYDSTEGEFLVNRGATYARLGDLDRAIQDFDAGLKLKPDHAVGYLNRSIMYQNKNRIDLALKDIESYLEIVPTNPDLWYEKARALRLLGKPNEAIIAYTQALSFQSSNKGMFYYERSKTYNEMNQMKEAKADLQQSIQLGFTNIDPMYRQRFGI